MRWVVLVCVYVLGQYPPLKLVRYNVSNQTFDKALFLLSTFTF